MDNIHAKTRPPPLGPPFPLWRRWAFFVSPLEPPAPSSTNRLQSIIFRPSTPLSLSCFKGGWMEVPGAGVRNENQLHKIKEFIDFHYARRNCSPFKARAPFFRLFVGFFFFGWRNGRNTNGLWGFLQVEEGYWFERTRSQGSCRCGGGLQFWRRLKVNSVCFKQ